MPDHWSRNAFGSHTRFRPTSRSSTAASWSTFRSSMVIHPGGFHCPRRISSSATGRLLARWPTLIFASVRSRKKYWRFWTARARSNLKIQSKVGIGFCSGDLNGNFRTRAMLGKKRIKWCEQLSLPTAYYVGDMGLHARVTREIELFTIQRNGSGQSDLRAWNRANQLLHMKLAACQRENTVHVGLNLLLR